MPLWVINLSLQFGWNMKFANIILFLLDQGYIPGIFGVSHGALQFIGYEELKKGYSHYFGTTINEKLVNTVCTCLCGCLYSSHFYINCLLLNLCLVDFLFLHRVQMSTLWWLCCQKFSPQQRHILIKWLEQDFRLEWEIDKQITNFLTFRFRFTFVCNYLEINL